MSNKTIERVLRTRRASSLETPTKFAMKRLKGLLTAACQTPFGEAYRHGEHLTNPALRAEVYSDPDTFRHDYMLYNLERKLNDSTSDEAKADKAIAKFIETDERLGLDLKDLSMYSIAVKSARHGRILRLAATKIESLIGTIPSYEDLQLNCGFSHGASAMLARVESSQADKYAIAYPEVTSQCLPLAQKLIRDSHVWAAEHKGFRICEHNRVTTVPKDSSIDRPIACEPTLNMYIQKGIGQIFRRQLRKVKIDLNDQTVNQRLAQEGCDRGLATIDLSAASDSISVQLCKLLLPQSWFDLLMLTRSERGLLPNGDFIEYNKISSMGNGFTFELESMLFWAIAQASEDETSRSQNEPKHRCSVYGDDIICRSISAPLLIEVLACVGFATNVDKSFVTGPFRESCGKHYFNGLDVSPFFIRSTPKVKTDFFLLGNNLRRWMRNNSMGLDDPRYVRAYRYIVSCVESKWQKPRIPNGMGDGAFYGSFDEVKPNFKNGKYTTKVMTSVRKVCKETDKNYLALKVIQHGVGSYLFALNTMDSIRRFSAGNSAEGTWDNNVYVPGHIGTRATRAVLYGWSDS